VAIYMKLSDPTIGPNLAGPEDPTADIALPPGQPAGFSVAQSWAIEAFQWGASSSNAFAGAAAGTGATAGRASPSDFTVYLLPNNAAPLGPALEFLVPLFVGNKIQNIAVTQTRPATGGLSQAWVLSYWLFGQCLLTNYVSSCADPDPVNETVSFAFASVRLVRFAAPAGGVLGASKEAGWDVIKNNPV
jgi:hypothetical protein